VNSQRLKVAIRVDASAAMGLGHLTRCLSLARALCAVGANVLIVARDLGIDIHYLLRNADVEYVMLAGPKSDQYVGDRVPHAEWAGVDWQTDATDTVHSLRNWNPDWVVVDHYAFDARWHGTVAHDLNVRIACIDDLADRDLAIDLLVDHNFHHRHADKYGERLIKPAAIVGGPRYALLDPAYRKPSKFSVKERITSIGIFMGGVDAANLSGFMVAVCRESLRFDGDIEIVISRAYPHAAALSAMAKRWPNTRVLTDLPNLADFFARHDLQIGAGGGATWERCCMGAPTLLAIAATNQLAVLPAIAELGVAEVLLPNILNDPAAVAARINELSQNAAKRREMSERAQALVDGKGALRVALRIGAAKLAVRQASNADAEKMFLWRNHDATRSMSLDPRELTWDQHANWLSDSLKNRNRRLFVAHVGAVDVGIVRFDFVADGAVEVSLYLDPDLHGLGLGRRMLLSGEERVCSEHPNIKCFTAIVLDKNIGSQRMFEAAGYCFSDGMWRKPIGRNVSDQAVLS
jgi:UDP-2,4-diacetamido-2,4,6-trideoxy-beta-L-altropyranose hydrolase